MATVTPRRRAGLFGPLIDGRRWAETLHLLVDLPMGVAFFTFATTMLAVSGGLIVTLVGLPLLAVTIVCGRVVGRVERWRARTLLGAALADFAPLDQSGTVWQRAKAIFADGPGWRGLAYCFAFFPLSILNFVVTVVLWSVALWLVTLPGYGWFLDANVGNDNYQLTGWSKAGALAGAGVLGLALVVLTPRVVRGLAALDRIMIEVFLSPGQTAQLTRRVEALRVSRDASLDQASADLRRIERDLHDGAQQRLVSLAMDLGMAKERLAAGGDTERATELVTRAHEDAKAAIAELRDLVRGIAPGVLTERGLDAALSALAARSPVPIILDVSVARRLASSIEASAYFIVAEALTNIAKHSRASHGWVTIRDYGVRLVLDIRDDGVGGATVANGGGLAGMRDRVAAAEGHLQVSSPIGGPTVIIVELPCAS